MRYAVVDTIYKEALHNKNIVFITGDLDHIHAFEWQHNLGSQYINAGIAEQNMMGMAAGLALTGKKVFVYTIVPFATMRCFEQVKNDVCYQNVDVTIIGVGGGFIYGQYANTHCSIEDIAVMRVLPNMKVVSPANPLEAEQLTISLIKKGGPSYMRIGRGKEPMPEKKYHITFGRGHVVKRGNEVTLVGFGTIVTQLEEAAKLIEKKGVSCEVINMHTIKPLDKKLLLNRLRIRRALFTIEEASIIGGLGSAVAELIAENGIKTKFARLGVADRYLKEIGNQEYLRSRHGISASKIAQSVLKQI